MGEMSLCAGLVFRGAATSFDPTRTFVLCGFRNLPFSLPVLKDGVTLPSLLVVGQEPGLLS